MRLRRGKFTAAERPKSSTRARVRSKTAHPAFRIDRVVGRGARRRVAADKERPSAPFAEERGRTSSRNSIRPRENPLRGPSLVVSARRRRAQVMRQPEMPADCSRSGTGRAISVNSRIMATISGAPGGIVLFVDDVQILDIHALALQAILECGGRLFGMPERIHEPLGRAAQNVDGVPSSLSSSIDDRMQPREMRRALHGPEASRDLRRRLANTVVLLGLIVADGTDGSRANRRNSTFLSASPGQDRARADSSPGPAAHPAQARSAAGSRGMPSPPPGSGYGPARPSPETASEASPSSRARAKSPDGPAAASVSSSWPRIPRPGTRQRKTIDPGAGSGASCSAIGNILAAQENFDLRIIATVAGFRSSGLQTYGSLPLFKFARRPLNSNTTRNKLMLELGCSPSEFRLMTCYINRENHAAINKFFHVVFDFGDPLQNKM